MPNLYFTNAYGGTVNIGSLRFEMIQVQTNWNCANGLSPVFIVFWLVSYSASRSAVTISA
jgi:hypothetical protein